MINQFFVVPKRIQPDIVPIFFAGKFLSPFHDFVDQFITPVPWIGDDTVQVDSVPIFFFLPNSFVLIGDYPEIAGTLPRRTELLSF